MIQTIKSKVAVAGAGLLILSAAMGGCGIWASNRLAAEMAQSARVSGLLRDHMQADMMHDAMRGDVLAAILSHDPRMGIRSDEVQQDAVEHAETFSDSVTEAKSLADEDLAKTLNALDKPISDYAEATKLMVALGGRDPDRAITELPRFMETFRVVEGLMAEASEKIETRVEGQAKEAAALAQTAQLILMIALAIGLMGVGALIFAANRILVAPLVSLTGVMTRLADGQLDIKVPGVQRQDEIGAMARATDAVFKRVLSGS